jgi:hypothetical protein
MHGFRVLGRQLPEKCEGGMGAMLDQVGRSVLIGDLIDEAQYHERPPRVAFIRLPTLRSCTCEKDLVGKASTVCNAGTARHARSRERARSSLRIIWQR